eukprot:c6143_g1_i1.p1 GENE.c6143_g1_i1~~c6143_g1_i1.p1  ORF type:complete len:563 (-),score=163.47 c6143_g1_i1:454-2118(-)
MRTVPVVILLVLLTAIPSTNAINPGLLDCTAEEINSGSVKCKPRVGNVKLSDSAQLLTSLKSVFEQMGSMLGDGSDAGLSAISGDADGSSGNSNGADASSGGLARMDYANQITEGIEHLKMVEEILQLRQAEIDHVSHSLIPACQQVTLSHLVMSRSLQKNISRLMDSIQTMTNEMSPSDVLAEQTKLSAQIVQFTQLRSTIELSEAASSRASAILLRQSALLQKRVRSELLPYVPEDAPLNPDDDDKTNNELVLLETAAQLTISARDRMLSLMDEIIEGFKTLQTMIREQVTQSREKWSDEIELLHAQLDVLVVEAGWFHTSGVQMLGQQSMLRGYLRRLTKAQYQSMKHHSLITADLGRAASQYDTSMRLRNGMLPLVNELVFVLANGDAPYTHPQPVYCLEDRCGVCGGDGRSCVVCGDAPGKVLDVCGQCSDPLNQLVGGASCNYFCDGRPDSGQVHDMCGECGGRDQGCEGCDGLVLSGATFDRCGVCGGNGKSCELTKGCVGVTCAETVPVCPHPLVVVSSGFRGCCFNPLVDCVVAPNTPDVISAAV